MVYRNGLYMTSYWNVVKYYQGIDNFCDVVEIGLGTVRGHV